MVRECLRRVFAETLRASRKLSLVMAAACSTKPAGQRNRDSNEVVGPPFMFLHLVHIREASARPLQGHAVNPTDPSDVFTLPMDWVISNNPKVIHIRLMHVSDIHALPISGKFHHAAQPSTLTSSDVPRFRFSFRSHALGLWCMRRTRPVEGSSLQ